MAGLRAALVRGAFWALCCGLAGPADGANFLQAGKVDEQDAVKAFEEELSGVGAGERQLRLEAALRTTYRSLPKNEGGKLGHKAIRYALHRLFVQQHGWYVRGLEPGKRASSASQKEWVPSFLEEHLEQRLHGRGASLQELAAMASALESLVAKEARGRLAAAFELHGLPTEGSGQLAWHEVEDALGTYYLAYLLAGNFSSQTMDELNRKKKIFAQKYPGWQEARAWFNDIVESSLSGKDRALNFDAAHGVAVDVGDQYYKFNDLECLSLKTTLREMESKRAGRVRLSVFYNMSLYSHWRFTEKAEYLRTLGALDDSDAEFPQVIIPNYLTARTNCLEASSLYALCCRNECEDLLAHLEERLAAPEASSAEIAALVSSLPSDTVQAPRELPERLRERLDKIARGNGGAVPIHGRLFAQWMHHAFPNECPYPHEANSTGPVTPDEWVGSSGDNSHTVSDEELMRTIEVDTCASAAGPDGPCGGATELPWSDTEELLIVQPARARHVRRAAGAGDRSHAPLLDGRLSALAAVALVALPAAHALLRPASVTGSPALWRLGTRLAEGLMVVFVLRAAGVLDAGAIPWALGCAAAALAASLLREWLLGGRGPPCAGGCAEKCDD